jgi:hypothetical protein
MEPGLAKAYSYRGLEQFQRNLRGSLLKRTPFTPLRKISSFFAAIAIFDPHLHQSGEVSVGLDFDPGLDRLVDGCLPIESDLRSSQSHAAQLLLRCVCNTIIIVIYTSINQLSLSNNSIEDCSIKKKTQSVVIIHLVIRTGRPVICPSEFNKSKFDSS